MVDVQDLSQGVIFDHEKMGRFLVAKVVRHIKRKSLSRGSSRWFKTEYILWSFHQNRRLKMSAWQLEQWSDRDELRICTGQVEEEKAD